MQGPAKFAFVLSSDPAIGMFRRFEWLSTLCLLKTQETLSGIENTLNRIHQERRRARVGPEYRADEYQALLCEAEDTLSKYSNLAQSKHCLLQFKNPLRTSHISLLDYIYDNRDSLSGVEYNWVFREGDLMVLDSRPAMTHLAGLIHTILIVMPGQLFQYMKVSNEPPTYCPSDSVKYNFIPR